MRLVACVVLAAFAAGCGSVSQLERPSLDLGLISPEDSPAPALRGPGVGIEKGAGAPRVSEEDIRNALESAPPLDGPPRVAIVEITGNGEGGFTPVPAAPEELEAFRVALGEAAASVQAVPQMFLPRQADLPALRYAAARIGADALFIYGRGSNHETYFNGWSNLNWFILPIFVIPGKTVEVYAAAEGALVDVRTSRVRAVTSADSRRDCDIATSSSSERPRTELEREASMETLKGLGTGLARELDTLRVGKK